jgi:hypothetical protein
MKTALILIGLIMALVGGAGLVIGIVQLASVGVMSEAELGAMAAEVCDSGETLVQRTRTNADGGNMGFVFYCVGSAGVERNVTDEVPVATAGGIDPIAVLLGGVVVLAVGIVMMVIGVVIRR